MTQTFLNYYTAPKEPVGYYIPRIFIHGYGTCKFPNKTKEYMTWRKENNGFYCCLKKCRRMDE